MDKKRRKKGNDSDYAPGHTQNSDSDSELPLIPTTTPSGRRTTRSRPLIPTTPPTPSGRRTTRSRPLIPTTTPTTTGSRPALRSRPLIPSTPPSDHTNDDDDSEFDPDTDQLSMDRTNEDDDSDYSPGHTQLDDSEMILPDPITTTGRKMGTRSRPLAPATTTTVHSSPHPDHHSEDEEENDDHHPDNHSEDDDDDHSHLDDDPPPPKRLFLTYGDFTVEFAVPPQFVQNGDNVFFGLSMSATDNDEDLVELDAIGPTVQLVPAAQPAPQPPPQDDEEPFQLPRQGTLLRGIFDAIKTHLGWGDNPGETDANNMEESPEFSELMESLPQGGDSRFGRGGPSPTLIKKGSSAIMVKWQDEMIWCTEVDFPFTWRNSQKKCRECWQACTDKKAGYCRKHSSKDREVVLLRDSANLQDTTIIFSHPRLRMTLHTEDTINNYVNDSAKCGHLPTLAKYYTERWPLGRARRPRFVMDKRWSFATTLSLSKYNTFTIATSIMTFLHNNAFPNSILPKIRLKMSQIHYEEADWSDVGEILTRNGFKFTLTPTKDPLPSSPLFPTPVINSKPHTYQGDDNGQIYDGVVTTKRHTHHSGASVAHSTLVNRPLAPHLSNVVSLYQNILPDPEETESRTLQAEFMGIMATLMGTILQKSINGKRIRPMTKQLNHFDEVFSYSIFTRLFRFKTGCKIIVVREGDGIPIINRKPQFVWS